MLDSDQAWMRMGEILSWELINEFVHNWKFLFQEISQGDVWLLVLSKVGGENVGKSNIFDIEGGCLLIDLFLDNLVFVNPLVVEVDLVAFEGRGSDEVLFIGTYDIRLRVVTMHSATTF